MGNARARIAKLYRAKRFLTCRLGRQKTVSALTPGSVVERVRPWIILIFEGETAIHSGDTREPGILSAASREKSKARPGRTSSAVLVLRLLSNRVIELWLFYLNAVAKSPGLRTPTAQSRI